MRGDLSALVSTFAALYLAGCSSVETKLYKDHDGVDKETADRLVGGEVDLAAFYRSGFFRITKPDLPEFKDDLGYRDLDEQTFESEVIRGSRLPWRRPPSAVLIYFPGSPETEDGFPRATWSRVKRMLQKNGFQPVILIASSSTYGPSIGVGFPYRRPGSIEKSPGAETGN